MRSVITNLALCERKMANYDSALELYQKVLSMEKLHYGGLIG